MNQAFPSNLGFPWIPRITRAVILAVALLANPGEGRGEPRPSDAEIGTEQVFLTPGEALAEIFGTGTSVDTLVRVLDADMLRELHRTLGAPVTADTLVVWRVRDEAGRVRGLAVITEEAGKYRPFRFMIGVTPDREVKGVEVLIYRESRGGEVRKSRFLRQYRGKSAADPLRTNRDILNIAGATISVNALNHGVRRVLLTLDLLESREPL